MSDNYNVYVNDDTEPNVSVSADSDVSALVDDDSNVVLDVEEDAGALLNADINDEELVDVPIEETIGELGADHRRLLHRDAADQHPMSAITGLTDSLTGLQNTIDSGLISVETSVSDVTLLANGKNTVYHSATMPTGGEYKVGDTWFNSSESYCMYKWDGSNWIREQFGNGAFANASIWNATIRDGAITNAKIEDATIENGKIKDATIESAKISSLDGDKITANSLTIGKMASDVTDAITSAGETASNYLTYISGRDGICVHESGDTSNYVNLNSSGMGVYAGGALRTSVSSSGVNLYGGTNIGASITSSGISLYGNGYLGASITSSGMTVYSRSTSVADFGSTVRIGASGSGHISVSSNKLEFYDSGTRLGYIKTESSVGHFEIEHSSGNAGVVLSNGAATVHGNTGLQLSSSNGKVSISGSVVELDPVVLAGTLYSSDYQESSSATPNTHYGASRIYSGYYKIGMVKSSSSRRYKHDIKPIENDDLNPHNLYDLGVVQFVYNKDYLDNEKDDRYDRPVAGFVAEEMREIYPTAVDMENGRPETWNPRYIIPPMLALIQEQNKRITELEKRVL